MRRGVSLLEALLATAIVGVVLTSMMYLFMSTRQQAVGSEQRLAAAMLAQMVIERLKSELAQNPAYFRQLPETAPGKWTFRGTVTEPAAGAQLSPFFEHLFARGTTALYEPANRISISPALAAVAAPGPARSEAESLLYAYRDYEVAIRIEDDADLEKQGSGADGPLKELVKVVTVAVSRISRGANDPQAYRVSARVLAPIESLSLPALDALYRNFEGSSLKAMWAEFFLTVKDNLYFKKNYLSLDSKKLLADCYIVLGATNTEAYLTEGQTVSGNLVFSDGKPTQSIDSWIALTGKPEYYRHSVFKKTRAHLQTYKATVVFEAIKKVAPVLDHMIAEHDKILPKIDELTKLMKTSLDGILKLNQDTLDAMEKYKYIAGEAKRAKAEAAKGEPKLREEVRKLREDAAKLLEHIDLERSDKRRKERIESADRKRKEADFREAVATRLAAGMSADLIEQDLLKAGDAPIAAMQQANGSFAQFGSDRAGELMKILELVVLVSFIRDFFGEQNNRKVADRLAQYPVRFAATMDELEKSLVDQLEQPPGGTPAEQVGTALALAEVEKVRQLEANAPDTAALARLTGLGNQYASTVRQLSKYLTSGEVHDLETLRARNARFLDRLQKMKQLARKYLEVTAHYDAGGKIFEFLELYTRLSRELRLESGSIISRIQRQVQTLRGQLDAVGDLTKEEILSAMKTVE